ncbi:band 7 protein AGAP004871 isoform X7 [Drosophila rhopaloa]|uniref:Band 7 domain-containing protein n=1 Tax=Drosophila rhopaloa TaxID=1041015 RepID=A0ABM5J4T8_DRORH|nr:band 7 protein AGAP004871 isoform X7 [Drosophila rhopaloa]
MVEEFLQKLPEIDTRYEDIVPMEQVSSMVSNGGGSVAMQRDDEYRNRIMKSKCVSAKISDRTDSLWQATATSMQQPPPRHGRPAPPHQHSQYQHQHHNQWPLHHQNHQQAPRTTGRHTMLGSNHSSQREASVSPRRVALDTTASGSTSGFGFDRADEEISDKASTCGKLLIFLSVALVIMTLPFSLFVCFKVVQEYERAVIFRLGRLMQGGAKGPGIFFILPCIDSYARVDLRTRTYDVPPQEVLTKDSVTVSVDAVVYYRVSNATVSIANVENAHHSTRLLAQTTLRNTMGTRHLHEILSERMTISGTMQVQLDEATDAWGIKVERVEIKDVRLPVQLQRAMAAEAEAAREARAKVIAAEGEQKASRALREASEVIGDSPAALQLRYLQTLNTISAEKNSTIVFPLPIDLITYFLKTNEASTQKNARAAAAAIGNTPPPLQLAPQQQPFQQQQPQQFLQDPQQSQQQYQQQPQQQLQQQQQQQPQQQQQLQQQQAPQQQQDQHYQQGQQISSAM